VVRDKKAVLGCGAQNCPCSSPLCGPPCETLPRDDLGFEWISRHAGAILEDRMKSDQRSVRGPGRYAGEAGLCDQARVEIKSS